MKITVDGQSVEATPTPGSQIWTFANGEVRQLRRVWSAPAGAYKTLAVVKAAPAAVKTANTAKVISANTAAVTANVAVKTGLKAKLEHIEEELKEAFDKL